jgi:hypothetical protein
VQCSEVGAEAWFFLAMTTALVVLFVVRSRQTQRWLREGHWPSGAFFWYPGLERPTPALALLTLRNGIPLAVTLERRTSA